MTTVSKPEKNWEILFEQADKDITAFKKAVFEWQASPETITKDSNLKEILSIRERGKLTMELINRPDISDAYCSEIRQLFSAWTEADTKLFNRLETDKYFTQRIADEDFSKQFYQIEGDLRRFFSQNLKADSSDLKTEPSQYFDNCPEPGMLDSFALNELDKDQAAVIQEHIDSCFLCQDLVFKTMMAENEAYRNQNEPLQISDNFLSEISSDLSSEFYKRLVNLVIIVNAQIKKSVRNQFFHQKRFVFATASSDEKHFKSLDEIPFELIITPRDSLLQIPCTGDSGEGKDFIDDILEKKHFYSHLFAWDVKGKRTDFGIFRHEQETRMISVIGFFVFLMVLGLDGNVVEEVGRRVPEWLKENNPVINVYDNSNIAMLLYRIK